MSLSIKIKEVKPLEDFVIYILFENGVKKLYDVKQLFDEFPDMFAPFNDNPAIFKNAYVDCGGCGVSWTADIDISECELWENGVEISENF